MGTHSTCDVNYSDTGTLQAYQNHGPVTSNFEVEGTQFKMRLNWEKNSFANYATKASLVLRPRRSGQPYLLHVQRRRA